MEKIISKTKNLNIKIQKRSALVRSKRKGFSLIEVVVATGLLAVALSSILTLAVNSQKNTRFLAEKTFATIKASDGLELMRRLRDDALLDGNPATDWQSNLTNNKADEIKVNAPFKFENKDFIRLVVVKDCGPACKEIQSTVSWDTHLVTMKTQLTDWRLES